MKRRTKARTWALQVLYAWEMRGAEQSPSTLEAELAGARSRPFDDDLRAYALRLLRAVEENLSELDVRIEDLATNWRLSRMTAVDRNVLRLAAAEMLVLSDVPLRVSLHEGIRLAEWFGTDDSSRFINGILDALLHELETEQVTDRG